MLRAMHLSSRTWTMIRTERLSSMTQARLKTVHLIVNTCSKIEGCVRVWCLWIAIVIFYSIPHTSHLYICPNTTCVESLKPFLHVRFGYVISIKYKKIISIIWCQVFYIWFQVFYHMVPGLVTFTFTKLPAFLLGCQQEPIHSFLLH